MYWCFRFSLLYCLCCLVKLTSNSLLVAITWNWFDCFICFLYIYHLYYIYNTLYVFFIFCCIFTFKFSHLGRQCFAKNFREDFIETFTIAVNLPRTSAEEKFLYWQKQYISITSNGVSTMITHPQKSWY